MAAWSLTTTQGGWLAGIISGGYMLGVPLVAATTGCQHARFISHALFSASSRPSVLR